MRFYSFVYLFARVQRKEEEKAEREKEGFITFFYFHHNIRFLLTTTAIDPADDKLMEFNEKEKP